MQKIFLAAQRLALADEVGSKRQMLVVRLQRSMDSVAEGHQEVAG